MSIQRGWRLRREEGQFSKLEVEKKMAEAERLVDLLERSFSGKSWHGPALKEVLAGVDAAKASARPIQNAHTIWEIVLHVAAWTDVVRLRVKGEKIKEPNEGDFPPVSDPSEAAWQSTLADLETRHQALKQTALGLNDSELEKPRLEGAWPSYYLTLHGAVHHYLYHAGQIALLKKL